MSATVHWCLAHSREVPEGSDWLGPGERALLHANARAARRQQWRLGRWTAKQLLAESHRWDDVEVRRADDGAPLPWRAGRELPVSLSISHRNQLGLACATEPGIALGGDIELIERRRPVFVDDYFTAAERDAIARADPSIRDELITVVWSGKESALKALRTGLRRDTRSVEVEVGPAPDDAGWRPLRVMDRVEETPLQGCWRTVPAGGDTYVITIVADTALAPAAPTR